MTKPLKDTIHLKGIRGVNASTEPQAWLNHRLLKLDKSLRVKSHSLNGFGWGNDDKGAHQLALAICLEIYPLPIAVLIYANFCNLFIAPISQDSFSITLALADFNKQEVTPLLEMAGQAHSR